MATSDYPGRTALVGFFFQSQKASTAAQREAFSQNIFDKFNSHIVTELANAVPSPRTRRHACVERSL